MGTAMNLICSVCSDKTNKDERPGNYFINETDTSAPQSLMEIKISSKNFVVLRQNKNIFCLHLIFNFI